MCSVLKSIRLAVRSRSRTFSAHRNVFETDYVRTGSDRRLRTHVHAGTRQVAVRPTPRPDNELRAGEARARLRMADRLQPDGQTAQQVQDNVGMAVEETGPAGLSGADSRPRRIRRPDPEQTIADAHPLLPETFARRAGKAQNGRTAASGLPAKASRHLRKIGAEFRRVDARRLVVIHREFRG